jgi:hypothetical protein
MRPTLTGSHWAVRRRRRCLATLFVGCNVAGFRVPPCKLRAGATLRPNLSPAAAPLRGRRTHSRSWVRAAPLTEPAGSSGRRSPALASPVRPERLSRCTA